MQQKQQYEAVACPICSGQEYQWGEVRAQGLTFAADEESAWSKMWKFGYKTRARLCTRCGNVQMFFSKK